MKFNKKEIIKFLKEATIYVLVMAGLICFIPQILIKSLHTDYPLASITSGSMWPLLKKGDLVVIKGVEDKKSVQVGDIIVFENERGFTIHRVVKLNENTVITKGDANNVNDAPIAYEQIVGKLVTFNNKPVKLPFLGMISIFTQKYNAS